MTLDTLTKPRVRTRKCIYSDKIHDSVCDSISRVMTFALVYKHTLLQVNWFTTKWIFGNPSNILQSVGGDGGGWRHGGDRRVGREMVEKGTAWSGWPR